MDLLLAKTANIPNSEKKEFQNEVEKLAREINVPAEWLFVVMWAESRFNPKAKYSKLPNVGAVGINQMMPETYKGFGYTESDILAMTATEQVKNLVRPYFKGGTYKNFIDFGLTNFVPTARPFSSDKNHIIGTEPVNIKNKGENWYKAIAQENKLLDLNQDGAVTIGEYEAYIKNDLTNALKKEIGEKNAKEYLDKFFGKKQVSNLKNTNVLILILIFAFVIVLIINYLTIKTK